MVARLRFVPAPPAPAPADDELVVVLDTTWIPRPDQRHPNVVGLRELAEGRDGTALPERRRHALLNAWVEASGVVPADDARGRVVLVRRAAWGTGCGWSTACCGSTSSTTCSARTRRTGARLRSPRRRATGGGSEARRRARRADDRGRGIDPGPGRRRGGRRRVPTPAATKPAPRPAARPRSSAGSAGGSGRPSRSGDGGSWRSASTRSPRSRPGACSSSRRTRSSASTPRPGPRFINPYLGPVVDRLRGGHLDPFEVDLRDVDGGSRCEVGAARVRRPLAQPPDRRPEHDRRQDRGRGQAARRGACPCRPDPRRGRAARGLGDRPRPGPGRDRRRAGRRARSPHRRR